MNQVLTSDAIMPVNYRELFYRSPLPMYTCDQEGYILSFNAAAEKLWETAPRIGQDKWCGAWELYHIDGSRMPAEQSPMAIALKEKRSIDGTEIIIKKPDYSLRYLLAYPQPMFDIAGKLIGGFSTMIDITDNKAAKEKQAILSAIVESSDDAIVSKDLNGFITSWNRSAQKIFGYSEKEMLGKHITILIPEELRAEEEVIIGRIRTGKKVDHFQTTRVTKYGKRLNISLTVSPIKNEKGEITGASKIARDITEQLQKQKSLEQYSQRLEILNSLGIQISAKLEDTSIIQLVTNATAEITGAAFGAFFSCKEDNNAEPYCIKFLSGASKELFHTGLVQKNILQLKQAFGSKRVIRIENVLETDLDANGPHLEVLDKHTQILSYMAVPVMNASGNIFGGLFFGHPLPGVFTREHEELVKSIASQVSVALENSALFKEVKKLSEKKDEFIALASHELKTPLTTVNGYLQVLQSRVIDATTQLFVERSLSQIKKLNSLVSDLFDISKVEAGKLQLTYEAFDLYQLLQEIVETYQHSCSTHQVRLHYHGTDCVVEADMQRIEQVIVNLITNAIKYSPNTDQVLVELKQSNNEATVMVKDKGIGLTKEQQQRIFTKFYRAEGTSNISGLGLGLYLSNEIIKRHRGSIHVKSELGNGAEFYFLIPVKKPAEIANGNK